MSIKIIKFTTKEKHLFKEACKIRTTVFVNEQKVTHKEEFDGLDDDATQYLVSYNDKFVGTARQIITKEGHKLERFAVHKEFRGKQIGASLLDAMMKDIVPKEKNIYLNAQISAINFYAKYGFEKVGKMFVEANIQHYKMIYKGKK